MDPVRDRAAARGIAVHVALPEEPAPVRPGAFATGEALRILVRRLLDDVPSGGSLCVRALPQGEGVLVMFARRPGGAGRLWVEAATPEETTMRLSIPAMRRPQGLEEGS